MPTYLGRPDHWDRRYLELCKHISGWSKDPSSKVGAVIVDPEYNNIVSLGFNGLPRGVEDTVERLSVRSTKLRMVVHGEMNALIFAARPVRGCKLYTYPWHPCAQCASMMVQAGISEVIAPTTPEDIAERWKADIELVENIFEEARVSLYLVEFS